MSLINQIAISLPRDLAYIALVLVLLFLARLFKDRLTPYKLNDELTSRDNPALGVALAGYYAGVLLLCFGPLLTPSEAHVPLWEDLALTGGYSLLGIVLLNLSRIVVDRLILPDFSAAKEIIDDRNVGMGAIEMGGYIASGLVIAGALHGEGGGPHTVVLAWVLGQVGFVLYARLLRRVCGYDLHNEVESDNVAAGVAFGLNLVAVGVVCMGAVRGDYVALEDFLLRFVLIFVVGSALLILTRFIVERTLLPGVRLHAEIAQDQNVGVAYIEGVTLIGIAGVIVLTL